MSGIPDCYPSTLVSSHICQVMGFPGSRLPRRNSNDNLEEIPALQVCTVLLPVSGTFRSDTCQAAKNLDWCLEVTTQTLLLSLSHTQHRREREKWKQEEHEGRASVDVGTKCQSLAPEGRCGRADSSHTEQLKFSYLELTYLKMFSTLSVHSSNITAVVSDSIN